MGEHSKPGPLDGCRKLAVQASLYAAIVLLVVVAVLVAMVR